MSSSILRIETARVLLPLLEPARYKGAWGGRGSMKSHHFAGAVVERCLMDTTRAVCIREVQRSLKGSSKRLIEDKIKDFRVGGDFQIFSTEIRGPRDSLITFQGMQDQTAESIKSLEGYDVAWVDEAQKLSKRSLRLLRPTIRKADSELWFSWNPEKPDDPVDELLRGPDPPPGAIVVETNWRDNPWFPDVLRDEKDYDFRVDPESAAHVWDGAYWTKSDELVLSGKWRLEEFEPVTSGRGKWDGPYHGADWGFASDPTTLVRFWLKPDGSLMVEAEAFRVGCDLLDTPQLFLEAVPDLKQQLVRADSARPETISHMNRAGFRFEGAPKWSGSVEDGIAWLRARPQIVIHPRCEHTAREARLWRYKTDRLTGDVLPALVDGNDNTWDGIRYGASPMIQVTSTYTLAHVR